MLTGLQSETATPWMPPDRPRSARAAPPHLGRDGVLLRDRHLTPCHASRRASRRSGSTSCSDSREVGTVRNHLRLVGRWRVGQVGSTRAGRPWLVLRSGELEATQWNGPVLTLDRRALARIGPDLLAAGSDPVDLAARLRRASPARLLGEVVQDQRLVAGMGNMWMSEALWAARVSPWLPLGAAYDDELLEALRRAQAAMRAAVVGARPRWAVYRRTGRPCRRCGTAILGRGQGDANRTAYWCPGCQRGPADDSGGTGDRRSSA